jgi:lactate dehydrogenase-like 2-hydroxyacid dehydrogenase
MTKRFRVYATCDIGDSIKLLRDRGYQVEVYPNPEPPPKKLIVEKLKSGIDGLITTLRDQVDAELFEAGKGTLKVVAQYAVGFDNINRADANRFHIPFTNTADVLTEATAEFAFFMMGALARKLWSAEHLTRENKWGFWHPYLPFLGDEVTGKTIAIIGTGRIGLAMIKKCAGFDMNMLCYDPAYQNHDYIKAIQETNDLRHARGICRERTWIKYVSVDEALPRAGRSWMRRRWPRLSASDGSQARPWMSTNASRFHQTPRCATRRSRIAAGCIRISRARPRSRGFQRIPTRAWRGAACRG